MRRFVIKSTTTPTPVTEIALFQEGDDVLMTIDGFFIVKLSGDNLTVFVDVAREHNLEVRQR